VLGGIRLPSQRFVKTKRRAQCARRNLHLVTAQTSAAEIFAMKTKSLIATAVLVLAIGAPVAGFVKDTIMPQQTTPTGKRAPFLHGFSIAQLSALPELASLSRADEWLNSPPLTTSDLQGKVVLIDFWTYTCINWLRTLPYVRAWSEKYKDQGLVIIGVHAPEFEFEKNLSNVRRAVKDLKVDYTVAVDNDHVIWRAFKNQYWPALYFIDAQGRIRHHQFGEGNYAQAEKVIQQLLAEAGASGVSREAVSVEGDGIEADADWVSLKSAENYVGYDRTQNFGSPGGAALNRPRVYQLPARLHVNGWALDGDWTVKNQAVLLNKPNGRIAYRFHARDLHLVMGPPPRARPCGFAC
jgi:thiol-disulfide isomerase/thioredoxin